MTRRATLRSLSVPSLRRAVQLVVVDMTTGIGFGVGTLVLGFGVVVGLTTSLPLPGRSWSNPFNLALMGLLYLAPLCAGVVTWMVQDYIRRGIATLASTSRGSAQTGVLPRVSAIIAWGVLGYLTMLILFSIRLPWYGTPEGPTLLLGLLAVMLLTSCTVVGWSVGALLSTRLAAPAVTLGLFGFMYTASYLDGWARRLAPIDPDTVYQPFLQPNVPLVLAQLFLLAGVALLAAGGLRPRSASRAITCVLGVLTLAGAVGCLSRTDPSATQLRGAPRDPVCAHGAIEVCLRPENALQLDDAVSSLTAAVTALDPFMPVPRLFSEPGMDSDAEQGPGVFVPVIVSARASYTRAAVTAVLPAQCPSTRANDSSQSAYRQLFFWAEIRIAGGAGPISAHRRDELGDVLAQDTTGQRAWVRERLKAVLSCEV